MNILKLKFHPQDGWESLETFWLWMWAFGGFAAVQLFDVVFEAEAEAEAEIPVKRCPTVALPVPQARDVGRRIDGEGGKEGMVSIGPPSYE